MKDLRTSKDYQSLDCEAGGWRLEAEGLKAVEDEERKRLEAAGMVLLYRKSTSILTANLKLQSIVAALSRSSPRR